ncbi:MAG: hypothetical protein IPG04_20645 [Polyangiaceae bacterium]|nr:hypothetical protein [Polyangiaceae bacterium]
MNTTGGNGGGGMPPGCDGLLGAADPCTSCVEASCCPEVDACVNDTNCDACLDGQGDACDFDPLIAALDECVGASCMSECSAPNQCNPVTNEGCDPAAGEACDLENAFVCEPAPNDAELCEACDSANGPWCVAGATCIPETNQCGRYCCDDADCGSGVCSFDIYMLPNVGICVGGASPTVPSCDAPAVSPSGGTCGAF